MIIGGPPPMLLVYNQVGVSGFPLRIILSLSAMGQGLVSFRSCFTQNSYIGFCPHLSLYTLKILHVEVFHAKIYTEIYPHWSLSKLEFIHIAICPH